MYFFCALANRFIVEVQVYFNYCHACSEQRIVEYDLHICSLYKEQFRSYKLLVCTPLAVFGPTLIKGYLHFKGSNLAFVSIA